MVSRRVSALSDDNLETHPAMLVNTNGPNKRMHRTAAPRFGFVCAGFLGRWIRSQRPFPAAVGDPCRSTMQPPRRARRTRRRGESLCPSAVSEGSRLMPWSSGISPGFIQQRACSPAAPTQHSGACLRGLRDLRGDRVWKGSNQSLHPTAARPLSWRGAGRFRRSIRCGRLLPAAVGELLR